MKTRYLMTGYADAAWNMGLDECILDQVSESGEPALRLYRWRPHAITIGYFQSLKEEVDEEKCSQEGVDIVRRLTGGGAVYHDRELTYSLITPASSMPDDILESYKIICGGLVRGFEILGIEAEFTPLNDITVSGRKISGNAQTRRKKCLLQHGTILLGVDVERMFSLLRVPNEKLRDKLVENARDRVTSVEDVLKKKIEYSKAVEAFKRGFSESLDLKLSEDKLKDSEIMQAKNLAETRYSTYEWNHRR